MDRNAVYQDVDEDEMWILMLLAEDAKINARMIKVDSNICILRCAPNFVETCGGNLDNI